MGTRLDRMGDGCIVTAVAMAVNWLAGGMSSFYPVESEIGTIVRDSGPCRWQPGRYLGLVAPNRQARHSVQELE